jgi:hypothetical protein
LSAALILHRQKLANVPIELALDQPPETAHAVIDMDNVVAYFQVSVHRLRRFGDRPLAGARLRAFPAKDFGIRD